MPERSSCWRWGEVRQITTQDCNHQRPVVVLKPVSDFRFIMIFFIVCFISFLQSCLISNNIIQWSYVSQPNTAIPSINITNKMQIKPVKILYSIILKYVHRFTMERSYEVAYKTRITINLLWKYIYIASGPNMCDSFYVWIVHISDNETRTMLSKYISYAMWFSF